MPTGVYKRTEKHRKSSINIFPKSGEKNGQWKGVNSSYSAFHHWLNRKFGKANKCENKNCSYKNPKRYDWALLRGKNHDHNRENYIQLCVSCHKKYDKKTRKINIRQR